VALTAPSLRLCRNGHDISADGSTRRVRTHHGPTDTCVACISDKNWRYDQRRKARARGQQPPEEARLKYRERHKPVPAVPGLLIPGPRKPHPKDLVEDRPDKTLLSRLPRDLAIRVVEVLGDGAAPSSTRAVLERAAMQPAWESTSAAYASAMLLQNVIDFTLEQPGDLRPDRVIAVLWLDR
jgi:hypothetical protein